MFISNEIAHELINILKNIRYKNPIIPFPKIGSDLKFDAVSENKRYNFTFVVNRKVVRPDFPKTKISLIVLYKNIALARVDTNSPNHRNPMGALAENPKLLESVSSPHIHIYNNKYNIAYPLDHYIDHERIDSVSDLIELFIKFLELCNVENINDYSVQETL